MCHASLDYVEGMSLYEWVTKHKEIEKGKLYLWIKELAAQLSMFQKQRGSPVYKYLTPHNVIVTRKGRIMLAVSKEERDSIKPLDKYFEPPYPNQAADVYCLGKMIQFIMAHVQCEPYLSKKEEFKLQKIVRKCLEANPKKQYEDIHMIQINFKENEKAIKYNKQIAAAAIIVTVAAAVWISAKGVNIPPAKDELIDEESILQETEENRIPERMLFEAGLDYFLENGEYSKSIEYFTYAGLQDKKNRYFTELAQFMLRGEKTVETEKALEELKEALIVDENTEFKEVLVLLRVYVLMDRKEEYSNVIKLMERENLEKQRENSSGELQKEFEQYRALIYEELKQWEEAESCYVRLSEMRKREMEENQLYQKKSFEVRVRYLENLWDMNSMSEKKIDEIKKAITEYPEIINEEIFVRFVSEKRIHIEGEKIWLEEV